MQRLCRHQAEPCPIQLNNSWRSYCACISYTRNAMILARQFTDPIKNLRRRRLVVATAPPPGALILDGVQSRMRLVVKPETSL